MSDHAIKVTARFKKRTGEEIAHRCEFPPDEWRTLTLFVSRADELARTTLLSTPSGINFSLHVDADGVMTFIPRQMPHPDHFRALLHLMRAFVLQGEATHFGKIRNILRRRLDHPAFDAYLERQKQIFDGARCQAFGIMSDGTMLNSSKMLDVWLNGYEYHGDEEKRQRFEDLHGDVLSKELTEALFVAMMLDRARVVIELRNAIQALRHGLTASSLPGDSDAV